MKKIRFISIFIFLAGMVFTVFQYLPSLEEETPAHRVELAKKDKNAAPSGDDDSTDTDSEDNSLSDLEHPVVYGSSFYFCAQHDFFTKNKIYKLFVSDIKSPPPKV